LKLVTDPIAALKALVDEGEMEASVVSDAIKKYGVDIGEPNPMTV
jgi:pyruvate dehydrogenase E1 component